MDDSKGLPQFSGGFWQPDPESVESWQSKHSKLAKTFQEIESGERDPLWLASLLKGMSIYGHDNLGDEIAKIIVSNVRRKKSKHADALIDRDIRLMIEAALNDDEFRAALMKTVNEMREGKFLPFDLEERRKIEITNAVSNLYGVASDSKDASGRASYDRVHKRAKRAKRSAAKGS